MQYKVKQQHLRSLLHKYYNYSEINSAIKLQDVCGRNTTFHTYHRMGYDG